MTPMIVNGSPSNRIVRPAIPGLPLKWLRQAASLRQQRDRGLLNIRCTNDAAASGNAQHTEEIS
jgi:hypothetical protein